jgi:DnaJ-class molecular chaperone
MSDDLYGVLGVTKGTDAGDIRKAFLKLAKTHHPDKGGDEAEFKKIQRAFEVLSDDSKRQMYDMTGQVPGEGGNGGGGGGPPGFAFDIGSLFGMFGPHMGGPQMGGQPRKRPGKPPSKVERIAITLAQFYSGHSFHICLDRTRFCGSCNGDGSKKKEPCGACHGSGIHSQVINMNGMTMHSRGPCGNCGGKGSRTVEPCGTCSGSGRLSEKKTLDAKVAPGTQAGEVLIFPEACSEVPEFEKAGDLHIIVDQMSTSAWQRAGPKGQHLEVGVTLTLAESLVGCIMRLEGHPAYDEGLFVQIPPASFAGDTYCISGIGMPIRGEAGMYGDLYVKIQVSVKLTERRILASEAGQAGVTGLFAPLCRTPDGFNEGKTEVQKELFLSRV